VQFRVGLLLALGVSDRPRPTADEVDDRLQVADLQAVVVGGDVDGAVLDDGLVAAQPVSAGVVVG